MKKSNRPIVAFNRKSIVCLAILLTAIAFILLNSKIDAKNFPGPSPTVLPEGGLLYVVDSTGDGGNVGPPTACNDGTGKCTLRAAIQAANGHAGNDAISFSIPVSDPNCSLGNCSINLSSALPPLSENVNISGPGANRLFVRRNSAALYRIFYVPTAVTLTLSSMTISDGSLGCNEFGGGIHNEGTLHLNDCAISGNSAAVGGGISNANTGTAFVSGSTISGNLVKAAPSSGCTWAYGGGIANYGSMQITNSTFYGNTASGTYFMFSPHPGYGGAIFNGDGGTIFLSNSTLANNAATSTGPMVLGYGGGFYDAGDVNIKNSIIANNVVPGFGGTDVNGQFTSEGFNLIGQVNGSTGFTVMPTDQFGTTASPLDPGFDPGGLRNNGGPTSTVALLCGSSAIDKSTSSGIVGNLNTDQRGAGFPRTLDDPAIVNANGGDGTDAGAFERQNFCRSRADFDGDLKTDLSVFRVGSWYIQRSTAGFTGVAFGLGSDLIVPGDYDGDGKADLAVFRTNTWFVLRSSDSVVSTIQWGASGDVPRAADYDGDAKTDIAVYRPSVNYFFIRRSTDLSLESVNWGIAGDVTFIADYDGDNKADYGAFRNGTWHILRSTAGYFATQFGIAGDQLVPADYDGDQKADIAVFRNGTWYLLRSTTGFTAAQWGIGTDTAAPGDYDGDGSDDLAVFRGSTGTWHILRSSTGYIATQFGANGDIAVPAGYIP